MEAPASTAQGFIAKIAVESHDRQTICKCILDKSLIVFCFDASLAGADYSVAPAIQKHNDRLDHVLIGEKG